MGEQKKTQWHPGFTAAIRMELRDNRDDLEFKEEHNLSKKPLQIDLLIIKNDKNVAIQNKIGKIFKRYNILEYKSPDDEMGVDAFYKVLAYACLYKSSGERENEYKANDITITFIRQRYPKTLIEYLENEGYVVERKHPGIYYITGKTIFDMQIIVSKELEGSENIWLHSLQSDISRETFQQLLLSVNDLEEKEREIYGDAVLEVVSNANISNIERWKGEVEMCATLEKIMAPELDARELRGELRGELKGELKGKVLAYAEMGISLEEIAKKVPLSVKEIEAIIARN